MNDSLGLAEAFMGLGRVALLVVLTAGTVFAKGRKMIELGEAGAGQAVSVPVGERVRVTLAEAGGTGYRWRAGDGCGGVLKLLEEHKGSAGTTTPGAGGSHVFIYSAEGAGSCELRFELRRSWEKAGVRAVVFPVTVR